MKPPQPDEWGRGSFRSLPPPPSQTGFGLALVTPQYFRLFLTRAADKSATPRPHKRQRNETHHGCTHVNKPANDNGSIQASDFTDLAARRAWLASAPSTLAAHHAQPPCFTWAKREQDSVTFFGLKLWQNLNQPPRTAANDNEPDTEDTEAGEQPVVPNLDRELVDVSAKQMIWAFNNNRTRWVGNRLVKVWSGHAWVSPDAEFGKVRQRKSDKADAENFDAETPDAQVELARAMNTERLRARLGHKVTTILDMASSDSTLAEIGEYLGFSGQYAPRMAGKEVRAAVAALNTAFAEGERLAA